MQTKIIRRYLSQKVVEQRLVGDEVRTWLDCEVEYTDGSRAFIRELHRENRNGFEIGLPEVIDECEL